MLIAGADQRQLFVSHRGREYVDAMGTLAFNSDRPMRRDTIFRLASMTKPITAVAAMILVEECKLRLDDPVDEWLPELKNRTVLRTINSPLDHMSSEILGVLIARVSGNTFGSFLRERIFEPLGMTDTGFFVPEAKLDRLPTCYGTNFSSPELVVLDEARGGQVARPPAFEAGAGGLVSTVDDMAAFGRMMLDYGAYGRERILSRPSIELMTTDHLTPEQKASSPFFENFWNDRGWGLGLAVFTKRNEVAGSPGRFGWDGAFSTSWYVDPKEALS